VAALSDKQPNPPYHSHRGFDVLELGIDPPSFSLT
jgi:hypothetical protein